MVAAVVVSAPLLRPRLCRGLSARRGRAPLRLPAGQVSVRRVGLHGRRSGGHGTGGRRRAEQEEEEEEKEKRKNTHIHNAQLSILIFPANACCASLSFLFLIAFAIICCFVCLIALL